MSFVLANAKAIFALTPTLVEADARSALAAAYAAYVATAESVGLGTILAGGVSVGQAAMEAALAGMSADGAGAGVIAAAIQAFWAPLVATPTLAFPTATALNPPGDDVDEDALQDVFDSNTAGELSLVDAANALGSMLHTGHQANGTVSYPGPSVDFIT